MKIVHIVSSFRVGGIETLLVDILNAQVINEDVTILVINNVINEHLINKISKKVKVIKLNRKLGSKNPIYFFKLNYTLFRLKPDIVHCHIQVIQKHLIFQNYKTALTVHSTGIKSKLLHKYNVVFSISKSVQLDIKNRYNVESKLVYNGLKIDQVRKRDKSLSDIFRIVNVSRLAHMHKGQDILVDALNLIVNDYNFREIELTLIGDGDSKNFIEDKILDYNLGKYVKMLGTKNRDYVFNNLADYDLFVQASRFEGFGLTVTEAMAAKLPVLVSDIEGPLEILEGGELGFIFKSENILDLSEKIMFIVKNYNNDIISKKVESAYLECKNKFDVKVTANTYLAEYYKL